MSNESSKVKYFRIGKVDSRGEVVGMWEIAPEKLPHDFIKYSYDDKGRVVRFEKHERDFPGKPSYRTYVYEGDSRSPGKSEWFDRYGNFKGLHRYYCDKGLMIKREELDTDGSIKYYILSKYDEYNRLTEEAWYGPDDKLDKRDVFAFDNPDIPGITPTEEEKYDENNELTGTFHYTWDERHNLIEKRWHNREGLLQSYYIHKYDKEDRIIWIGLYHEDDSLQISYEYKYDDVGNKISEKCFDGEGNLLKGQKWPGVFLETSCQDASSGQTKSS